MLPQISFRRYHWSAPAVVMRGIMQQIRWLAVIPFIGMFVGPILHNSATPFILGMPFILGWLVIWVLLTSAIMAVIYWLDPVRQVREEDAQ
jgi:Protein of unknown function (DUF3311)